MNPDSEKELQAMAQELRLIVLEMIYKAGSGHIGGCFSAAEILVALYYQIMQTRAAEPLWEDRDRLVVSKGHCAPMLYAVLARRGFFPMDWLGSLRRMDSRLQGHPDMRKTPGVEMSTGSLGHGLSVGVGMALGAQLARRKFQTYVLLGDGELNEGEIWEAALAAAKFRLNRLVVIVDRNGLQLDGPTSAIMPLEPLAEKWAAFGWKVFESDGHRIGELVEVVACARADGDCRPGVVIAHTRKGKGVTFMENNHLWHGKLISREDYARAVAELKGGGHVGN